MDDNQHWHIEQLDKHCRVCGQRLRKGKTQSTAYACKEREEDLELTYGVNTTVTAVQSIPHTFVVVAT